MLISSTSGNPTVTNEGLTPSVQGLPPFLAAFPVTELCLLTPSGEALRAKVDTEDLPKILAVSSVWHAYWHPGAKTHYVLALKNGRKYGLHRVVTDAPNGLVVDHRFHEGLDNRKAQLRVVTQGENTRNTRSRVGKFGRGVRISPNGKFQGQVRYCGKQVCLGTFDTPEQARQAREKFLADRGLLV